MDTQTLELNLKILEQKRLQLGQIIDSLRKRISELYSEANRYEAAAGSLISSAATEEDSGRASQLYSQASVYMSQAEQCRIQAEQIPAEIDGYIAELRGLKSEYQYYHDIGMTNVEDLKLTTEKLMTVNTAQYGAAKIKDALTKARQRLIYNQNLVNGCLARMEWIDEICGPDDSVPCVKLKKK